MNIWFLLWITWWIIIYVTVLARLYINFVTGINLGSSLALWVSFSSISSPFSSSCSLCFTALFGTVTSPFWLARLHGFVKNHFCFLSLSLPHYLLLYSWLLLSLLILALDSSLLCPDFEINFINSTVDRKLKKINLALFR